MNFIQSLRPAAVLLCLALATGPVAIAASSLTLTPEGSAAGLVITTFADAFPSGGLIGPRGIAFPDTGGVLVTHADGSIRKFPNTDGQHASAVASIMNYGAGNAIGLVKLGGKIYLAQPFKSQVTQLNDDGTPNQSILYGFPCTALAAGSTGGHIIAASYDAGTIWDIDVASKSATTLKDQGSPALAVSVDAKTFYAIIKSQIFAFRSSDGVQTLYAGTIENASGLAIGGGALANYLFVNTTDGQVYRVDQYGIQTLIATGGSRGDLMATAPDGSVLVTQVDSILRISAGTAPKFTLSATTSNVPATGGTGSVTVTASSSTAAWAATSNATWITITAGKSGTGTGTVTYSVDPNTATAARTGTITIAGSPFTVTEAGASAGGGGQTTFTLSSTSSTVPASQSSGTVSVTASASTAAWTATSNTSWISITAGNAGTGNGTVSYSVAQNTAASSRTGTLSIAGITFTITQLGASAQRALVSSTWDDPAAGVDGWTFLNDGTNLIRVGTGGNPGGFLQITDLAYGDVMYFVAPQKFRGNQSAAYGGTIAFDLQQSTPGSQFDADDVILTGNGITLAFDTTPNPATTPAWQSYSVSLLASAGWKYGSIGGRPATDAEMQSVLSNLTALSIRAEYSSNRDVDCIDNVSLLAPSTPPGGLGAFSLNPVSANVPAGASTGSVSVTTGSSTAPWTASSGDAWITISGNSTGTGNGKITYTVAGNTIAAPRTGTLTIAGIAFPVTQAAAGGIPLTLTTDGLAAGLTITSFADKFPVRGDNVGPLGITLPDSGGVLVADVLGNVRRFPSDADGQHAPDVTPARNYGNGDAIAVAKVGGRIYSSQQTSAQIAQLNDDGSLNQVIATGLTHVTGLVANPANGHLFAGSYDANAIWDVDPIAKTVNVFKAINADGLTVSPAGDVLYAEIFETSHIIGYRLGDGLQVFDSGAITGADGCALGTGAFTGLLFVNTNTGTLVQVSLATGVQTVLASGGSRGDFVFADPNGSLLVTQSDRILRITSSRGSFGGPATFNLSDTSTSISSGAAGGSVKVTTTSPNASWTATSQVSWITINSGRSGTGNGTVVYSVAANSSSSPRTGTMLIAGFYFTITQAGGTDPNIPVTVTDAGLAAGLTITSFADNFTINSQQIGPLGIVFPDSGGVLVASVEGNVRRFPADSDGQHAPDVTPASNYGNFNSLGLAKVAGRIYLAQQTAGQIIQLNDDGSLNQVVVTGLTDVTGLTANPYTGHLFASSIDGNAIWDVDPIARAASVFQPVSADGLTVSPGGDVLYAEVNSHILGYRISDGFQVFDSGYIAGADGCSAGTGTFTGFLFVNTNYGTLVQVNLGTGAQTVLASGGSRGDFVVEDPNGSLLVTQSDRILRITPASGSFGGSATFTLSSASASVSGRSGTGSITVNATSDTVSWTATSLVSWITITSGSPGQGSGTVTYSVAPNGSPNPRTGTLVIAGTFFTITQDSGVDPNIPLVLTDAGLASGLAITTFADNFVPDSGNEGPLGIAFPDSGGVLVSNQDGSVRRFPTDTDGQHADQVQPSQFYGFGNALNMTKLFGKIYMTQVFAQTVIQINDDGTYNQLLVTGLNYAQGLAGDPVNGHVYAGGLGLIADLYPPTDDVSVFVYTGGNGVRGVTVSPDGQTLYAEINEHIIGYRISDGAQIYDSGYIPGSDGCLVGDGIFAGSLIINSNDGNLIQIDLASGAQTVLASGGSRGAFLVQDPYDGSLLVSQTDRILRVTITKTSNPAVPAVRSPIPANTARNGLLPAGLRAEPPSSWPAVNDTSWPRNGSSLLPVAPPTGAPAYPPK